MRRLFRVTIQSLEATRRRSSWPHDFKVDGCGSIARERNSRSPKPSIRGAVRGGLTCAFRPLSCGRARPLCSLKDNSVDCGFMVGGPSGRPVARNLTHADPDCWTVGSAVMSSFPPVRWPLELASMRRRDGQHPTRRRGQKNARLCVAGRRVGGRETT